MEWLLLLGLGFLLLKGSSPRHFVASAQVPKRTGATVWLIIDKAGTQVGQFEAFGVPGKTRYVPGTPGYAPYGPVDSGPGGYWLLEGVMTPAGEQGAGNLTPTTVARDAYGNPIAPF